MTMMNTDNSNDRKLNPVLAFLKEALYLRGFSVPFMIAFWLMIAVGVAVIVVRNSTRFNIWLMGAPTAREAIWGPEAK